MLKLENHYQLIRRTFDSLLNIETDEQHTTAMLNSKLALDKIKEYVEKLEIEYDKRVDEIATCVTENLILDHRLKERDKAYAEAHAHHLKVVAERDRLRGRREIDREC